ncbi:MAG: bestrophin family ion channel [Saprospiraceae bacterium]|nr:bestrophin family ion channel [Saprospiraceae bacterium]
MHAGRNYTLKEVLTWTRRDIIKLLIIAAIPTILYELLYWKWMTLPWLPIALIGTAVAFLVGFKNNATYDRLWEARQIWGGIVNSSRTWGIMVKDFITNKHALSPLSGAELLQIHQQMIYRHVAWLTALRFQLREARVWENLKKDYNLEYRNFYSIPEHETKLEDELTPFLSSEEKAYILSKKNRATQLIGLQSKALRELLEKGLIEDFRHMEMQAILKEFYEHQGKCERIKNFPYPRQFATLNLYFVWLFILLLPFGMLQEFEKLGDHFVWLTVPFSALVSWVFHTMEKIGEATENPFEGTPNDIPMAALSRTIEIDLREMLEETELPEAVKPVNNILM